MIPVLTPACQRLIALLARRPRRRTAAAAEAPGPAGPEPAQHDASRDLEPQEPAASSHAGPAAGQEATPGPAQEEESLITGAAAADPAPFHHPHFIAGGLVSRDSYGSRYTFEFRPFTGDEAEPEMPDGLWEVLSEDDYRFLRAQYRCAHKMRAQARFRRTVVPLLQAAAPVWEEYLRTRDAMAATFAAFWETGDLQWRSQLLRLTDAHAAAQAAAQAWDDIAATLARAEDEHLRDVGEENELQLRDVAADAGLDISRWDIDTVDAYPRSWKPGGPAGTAVREEIDRQKGRLKEVDELAPLRGSAQL